MQSILDFNVSDANLDAVLYNFDGGVNFTFDPPYNISTAGWPDGLYNITVFANDTAGNNASEYFLFTVDGTIPVIELLDPANGSVMRPRTLLNFSVSDVHLVSANYSVDGAAAGALPSPFDIDTTGWADGSHNVTVSALDEAGNAASEDFVFFIDGSPPSVLWTAPDNGAVNVSVRANVTIQFSEPVDVDSFDMRFLCVPQAQNWVIHWTANNTTFYINPIMEPNTTYTIIIVTPRDLLGNVMGSNYSFFFTTWLDFDDDGLPDFNDTDDDNDWIMDTEDAFPLDPDEWLDTDGDGIGNNADNDDDGDGVLDINDPDPLDPNVSHVEEPLEGVGSFWWILGLMLLVVMLAVLLLFYKIRQSSELRERERDEEEEDEY